MSKRKIMIDGRAWFYQVGLTHVKFWTPLGRTFIKNIAKVHSNYAAYDRTEKDGNKGKKNGIKSFQIRRYISKELV